MSKITFENMTKARFLQEAQTKPVICFGAGDLMKFVERNIIRPNNLTVKYIVANSRRKQGKLFCGYEVYAPEKLLEEPAGSFVVLITTGYAYEVNEQLEAMGIMGAYPAVLFTEDFLGESYREIQLNRSYVEKGKKEGNVQGSPRFVQDWFAPNQKEELFQEVPLPDISGIVGRMGEDLKYAEMSLKQQAFLCGLLRQEKPSKIVEVGLAAGGTSALIVNYLNSPELEPEKIRLYSIDISTKDHYHPELEAGHIARKYDKDSRVRHEYLLGDVCAAFLDEICEDGKGIDFLILDAAHVLPGEVLDFLACLPYLNPGAVVVLHDVALSVVTSDGQSCLATGVLFSAVRGEKFYAPELDGEDTLSNIAAFRVNAETRRHVRDAFFALSLRWNFFMEKESELALAKYRNVISCAYDKSLTDLFDWILEQQKRCLLMMKIPQHLGYPSDMLLERWRKCERVYLYGTGYWGHLYYYWARFFGLRVDGMIVSDGREISEAARADFDVPVSHLSSVPALSENCGVLLAMDGKNYEACYNNLTGMPVQILNDKPAE